MANTASPWAPLRIGLFRMMWTAALVSNVGSFMQMVGAQWLLVHEPHAAILVSLVQTADMAPDLLFGLVGGVLADIFDRRRVLIVAQVAVAVLGAILTALTYAHQMSPALLLLLTFLLGFGSVLSNPAYQAIIPRLVPRAQIGAATSLNAVSVNLARVVGPALAGILIARLGVAAVFALNTATFVIFGLVVLVWRPKEEPPDQFPEQFLSAMRAGGQYIRHAPVVRRILMRATLFLVPGSALWALLPIIATARLSLGAGGYGLMLGALGAGAILGAFVLPRASMRLSDNGLVAAFSLVYAGSLAITALTRNPVVTFVALVPAGIAWMIVLSSINTALQLFLPEWVLARGLSVYQMVFYGAQALGAAVWGFLAGQFGLVPTFVSAAALMVGGAASVRAWPFIDTTNMDRGVTPYWPDPQLVIEPAPEDGPVVVQTTYTVAADKEKPFLRAMARVRLSRLRTGASWWRIFRDGQREHVFVELFAVPSWEEHLRQHNDRLTGTDRQFDDAASAFSSPPPQTSHFIAAEIEDDEE